jgi:hypothetical protein
MFAQRIARLLLLVVIPMALPIRVCAQSSRWVETASSSNMFVFADAKSLRRSGSTVRVWMKWVMKSPEEIQAFPKRTYMVEKSLVVFNCARRTSAVLQSIRYEDVEQTVLVDTRAFPASPAAFTEVAPETLGEANLEFACRQRSKG